jgi:hypothetical protein
MSRRIVAFAALVTKNNADQNAFLQRAQKATSEVFQFSSGWDLLNTLSADKGKAIDDLRIHDHGFYGGIIGDGNDVGFYTESYRVSKGKKNNLYVQASTEVFAYRVGSDEIKLAKDSSIITYGFNCSWFANDLSRLLRSVGRGDISVTGANNNVYEKDGKAHVDKRTDGLSKGETGWFFTYKQGLPISSKLVMSYR